MADFAEKVHSGEFDLDVVREMDDAEAPEPPLQRGEPVFLGGRRRRDPGDARLRSEEEH